MVAEGELLNIVTVWHVEHAMHQSGDDFRDHPLLLPVHELGAAFEDFSVLTARLPVPIPQKTKLKEPEEMLLPLAQLCVELGDRLQAEKLTYPWYYLELLDRDERVRPLCWISPELLERRFPDDRERRHQQIAGRDFLMENPYPRSLLTMDDVWRALVPGDIEKPDPTEWQEWFIGTWREHEAAWLGEGLLCYEPVRPWMSLLRFDERLQRTVPVSRWGESKPYPPLWLTRAGLAHTGLYWSMIPLYDVRDLQRIWWSMKQDLYVTSVFNLAAGPRQNQHLWRRLEERFQLGRRRMTRYRELLAYREEKVLEWTLEGSSLVETAHLLIGAGLHPLDPAGPLLAQPVPPDQVEANMPSARQVVVRIRKRLREKGQIERLPAGRPRKVKDDTSESAAPSHSK
ncbi:MAG: hypothetical protein ABFE07_08300 [Armatimonadia bacterium]